MCKILICHGYINRAFTKDNFILRFNHIINCGQSSRKVQKSDFGLNFLSEFIYCNALITTPGVNRVLDFDLKYLYDWNII